MFDDWNRILESIRVERMLETPQEFVRVRQPLSLLSAASDSMQHRPTPPAEKYHADAPISVSRIGLGASAVAPLPSDISNVSSFLQGLWASTNHEPMATHVVAPSSVVSDALAPLSFGAEPQSWPLRRLDQDFVNAAFQLAPVAVPLPELNSGGPDASASRPAFGPGTTSSRTLQFKTVS